MNVHHDEIDDAIVVEGQLYLLTANAACWKCGRPQDVVSIAAQGLSEGGEPIPDTQDPRSLVVLSAIAEMPSELLAFIQKRQPRYQKQYSRTAEMSYYANTCQCGALFGDHYLVSEPGGAFFPEDCADAARIEMSRVPCSPPLCFNVIIRWEMSAKRFGKTPVEILNELGRRRASFRSRNVVAGVLTYFHPPAIK